jgi:tetratricopeptide (TPR) repeat protein
MKEKLEQITELAKREDYPTALALIDKLTAEFPNEAKVWTTKAFVNGHKGDLTAAVDDWTKAIKLVEEPHYVYMRGIELFKLRKYKEAVSDFTRVIELCDFYKSDYYREGAYFFRADAYVRLKQFEKARADCLHVNDDMRTWTDKLRTKTEILAECG